HTEVGARMVAREFHDFFKPRTRHQHRCRCEQSRGEARDGRLVLVMAHAEVIGIDDEHPRVPGKCQFLRGARFAARFGHQQPSNKSKLRSSKEKGPPGERPFLRCRVRRLSRHHTVRMWMVQAEPSPMTCAWPTLALGTWRSFARSSWVICHTTSQMFATPVAPSGWPFERRPP